MIDQKVIDSIKERMRHIDTAPLFSEADRIKTDIATLRLRWCYGSEANASARRGD